MRAARAYADALASQHPDRDMFIFNTFMRTTMGESTEVRANELPPPTSYPTRRVVAARLPESPCHATAVFLDRATALFRDVVLATSGLPYLGDGATKEERERSELATRVLHPGIAALLRRPAAEVAGDAHQDSDQDELSRKGAAPVARVVGAKVVDAFAVWDGTICAYDLLKGGMEQYSAIILADPELKGRDAFPRPTDRLLAEEFGHSVSLHSAPSGPLHAMLAARGLNMGLHPLRRASMRVTVAFDCLERPIDAASTAVGTSPGIAASPSPAIRAIHTLTLEADIQAGVQLWPDSPGAITWTALMRALLSLPMSLAAERVPALRYLFRPPAVPCADGWRVVSIDGAGGGDGIGALSFSHVYELGRVLGRGSTFKRMHDAAKDEKVVAAVVAAGAIVSTLDVFSRELAALRDELCGCQPGASKPPAFLPRRRSAPALHPTIADLHGLSAAEVMGVALRAAGAAARAAEDVSKGGRATTRAPWHSRAIFEGWWEEVEAGCEAGAPPASSDVNRLFRWWAARELMRVDCFVEAKALAATQADEEEAAHPLTRTDLALVSAALARIDAVSASGPAGIETTPAGMRPLGTEPWELACDRRRRAAARRVIFEGRLPMPGSAFVFPTQSIGFPISTAFRLTSRPSDSDADFQAYIAMRDRRVGQSELAVRIMIQCRYWLMNAMRGDGRGCRFPHTRIPPPSRAVCSMRKCS